MECAEPENRETHDALRRRYILLSVDDARREMDPKLELAGGINVESRAGASPLHATDPEMNPQTTETT